MLVTGSQILARSLRRLQIDTFFYLMGGPMLAAESGLHRRGHSARSTSATSRPRR